VCFAGDSARFDEPFPFFKVRTFGKEFNGLIWQASLFVAVDGRGDGRSADGIVLQAHVHAFELCGGVPSLIVPDTPRPALREPAGIIPT
jgi:hypothetical protein